MGKIVKEIIWTDRARNDLNDIFYFYLKISKELASKVVSKIVKKIESKRDKFAETGQREPLLAHKSGEYRYLVEGNYKIIYQ
ncbi:MAG: type II toxin-antitoxin system RelE/ParE family toxin, partial [bacterium]|nr:type II toxin-antitoxin system RelE/ParE family toxin [bacterium]